MLPNYCQLAKNVNMGKKNPFGRTAAEYSSATTVHGVQYIFEDDLSSLEYCFWISAVFIGISLATLLSMSAYVEWKENPVLTTVASTGHPIQEIEFPSITICAQVGLYHPCFG